MAYQDWIPTVEKLYIAYYQRPADPKGLVFWAKYIDANGGLTPDVINAFANSDEAKELYGNKPVDEVITEVYNSAFNRDPDQEGLQFYTQKVESGEWTIGDVIYKILDGAKGTDAVVLQNKVQAATEFTKVIDPDLDGRPPFMATYDAKDIPAAREFLKSVGADPTTVPTEEEVKQYIIQHIADPGDPILQNLQAEHVFELSPGIDNITGTADKDLFKANPVYNQNTGTNIDTLNTGDKIDGKDGNDILETSTLSDLVSPELNSIENILWKPINTDKNTLDLGNSDNSLENIWIYTPRGDVSVDNIKSLKSLGLINITPDYTKKVDFSLLGSAFETKDNNGLTLLLKDAAINRLDINDASHGTDVNLNNPEYLNHLFNKVEFVIAGGKNHITQLGSVFGQDKLNATDLIREIDFRDPNNDEINLIKQIDPNYDPQTALQDSKFSMDLSKFSQLGKVDGSQSQSDLYLDIFNINNDRNDDAAKIFEAITGKGDDVLRITSELPSGQTINITSNEGNDTIKIPVVLAPTNVDLGAGNDIYTSLNGVADAVQGGDGDDLIFVGEGNNNVNSGAGNDKITTGDGDDTINGGPGNDNIISGNGADNVNGEDGDDNIITYNPMNPTDDGNDIVNGGAGNDSINTGFGDDSVTAGDGDDIISTGPGVDTVDGGEGNDIIDTGDGNDIDIYGRTGDDVIFTGAGDDGTQLYPIRGDEGNDYIDLGNGNNSWVYGDEGNDVIISHGGNDTNILGGAGDDTINVGNGDHPAYSYNDDQGNPSSEDANTNLVFGDTDHQPDYARGVIPSYANDGNDILYGGLGQDIIWTGGGKDLVILPFSQEHIDNLDQFITANIQLPAGADLTQLDIPGHAIFVEEPGGSTTNSSDIIKNAVIGYNSLSADIDNDGNDETINIHSDDIDLAIPVNAFLKGNIALIRDANGNIVDEDTGADDYTRDGTANPLNPNPDEILIENGYALVNGMQATRGDDKVDFVDKAVNIIYGDTYQDITDFLKDADFNNGAEAVLVIQKATNSAGDNARNKVEIWYFKDNGNNPGEFDSDDQLKLIATLENVVDATKLGQNPYDIDMRHFTYHDDDNNIAADVFHI